MAEKLKKGLFIAFEGPEGCGKSTQARLIAEDLRSNGYEVILTVEPGGTALGEKIRDVLLEKDDVPINGYAELFLFEADRAQHIQEVIKPAVEEGKIVITDRFNLATFAYQGYGLGMDMAIIEKVDAASTGGIAPGMTILLDIDAETGLRRAGSVGSPDRMEKRSVEFHERVHAGYLTIAKKDPENIKVVKVKDTAGETHGEIKDLVYDLVERYKRTE